MILGLLIGLLGRPEPVLQSFYEPLFRGLLSILMLVLGMEAWSRIRELKGVAHWFAIYALVSPILHGLIAFGLGYLAHLATGFSPGGVVLLAVIAASNSDISGPPTIRGGIPWANPLLLYRRLHQCVHPGCDCSLYPAFHLTCPCRLSDVNL